MSLENLLHHGLRFTHPAGLGSLVVLVESGPAATVLPIPRPVAATMSSTPYNFRDMATPGKTLGAGSLGNCRRQSGKIGVVGAAFNRVPAAECFKTWLAARAGLRRLRSCE